MIRVIGATHCARCRLVKDGLQKKQMAFTYENLHELTEEEQDQILADAEAAGISSMPVVYLDNQVSTQLSAGII